MYASAGGHRRKRSTTSLGRVGLYEPYRHMTLPLPAFGRGGLCRSHPPSPLFHLTPRGAFCPLGLLPFARGWRVRHSGGPAPARKVCERTFRQRYSVIYLGGEPGEGCIRGPLKLGLFHALWGALRNKGVYFITLGHSPPRRARPQDPLGWGVWGGVPPPSTPTLSPCLFISETNFLVAYQNGFETRV